MIYNFVAFISSFLIFSWEILFSQRLLPLFGGAYQVWMVCVFFYSFILFLGYWLASHALKWGRHWVVFHISLIIVTVAFLLIDYTLGDRLFDISLLGLLSAKVALPLFCLSLTAPMIQIYLDATRLDKSANLSFYLYAYSNLGAGVSLLILPFFVFPLLSLSVIDVILRISFLLYSGLFIFIILKDRLHFNLCIPSTIKPFQSGGIQFSWIYLPALSSAVYLSVTNFLSQRLGSMPFVWTLPLFSFLISFVFTFRDKNENKQSFLSMIIWPWVIGFILNLFIFQSDLVELLIYNLLCFIICYILHRDLYRQKPAQIELIGPFYLMISLGGVVGTFIISVLIPKVPFVLMNTLIELDLSMLGLFFYFIMRDFFLSPSKTTRSLVGNSITMIVVVLVVIAFYVTSDKQEIAFKRSFYGVNQVIQEQSGKRLLINGRTVHGGQYFDENAIAKPINYHHEKSPFAEFMNNYYQLKEQNEQKTIAMIGLGMGSMLYYAQTGDIWRVYEIDKTLLPLAKKYFSFIQNSPAKVEYVIGDARLKMENARSLNRQYDLIIMDAFGSASVPFHLLTAEALNLYTELLAQNGGLLFNISTRLFDLAPMLNKFATQHGYYVAYQQRSYSDEFDSSNSKWLVMTKNPQLFELMLAQGWESTEKEYPLWYDQKINFWPAATLR